jgi:hypothetical protein
MYTKKKILLLLIISLIGFGIGAFLLKVYDCGNSIFCYNLTTSSFALYYGMPALALIFLILLFTPQAFPAWKKFAVWFIPIATLIFMFYKGPSSGDYFSPYPEQIFRWISTLYVIVSILIILRTTIKQKIGKAN